jgi:hypothetical protein
MTRRDLPEDIMLCLRQYDGSSEGCKDGRLNYCVKEFVYIDHNITAALGKRFL